MALCGGCWPVLVGRWCDCGALGASVCWPVVGRGGVFGVARWFGVGASSD